MARLLFMPILILGTTAFVYGQTYGRQIPGTPVTVPEVGSMETMLAWALVFGAALAIRARRRMRS